MPKGAPTRLPITEREIRRSITSPQFRGFHTLSFRESWRSHHAEFYQLRAKYSAKREEYFVIKRYVPSAPEDELSYRYQHDPRRLYVSEKTNLDLIASVVSSDLVPSLYGFNDAQRVIFEEFLTGRDLSQLLIEAVNQSKSGQPLEGSSNKKRLLIGGIRNLARFVGLCNAQKDELDHLGNFGVDYESAKAGKESVEEDLFRTYLSRIFYSKHPDCLGGDHYRSNPVLNVIRDQNGISIEDRVREIFALKPALNERVWLQHGDYNVAHVFGDKVVDLEDFGYYPWTRDLSTFFMGGIDNISVPDGRELPQFLGLFLAYKHAFQTGNSRLRKSIDEIATSSNLSSLNAQYLESIGAIEDRRSYAEFMFSFFASAIEEGVHLDATLKRYSEPHLRKLMGRLKDYSVEQMKECKRVYTQELFHIVEEISPLTSMCGNPEGVREYFGALGQTLCDVEAIYLEPSCLERIRKPTDTAESFYQSILPRNS